VPLAAIRAGDLDGLWSVYTSSGDVVLEPGEHVVRRRVACELAAFDVSKRFRSRSIFASLRGPPTGTLFVTDRRMIFVRDIDVWREVKPLMTPLGMPTGIAESYKLKAVKAQGGRRYCIIPRAGLRLKLARRWARGRGGRTRLRVDGEDGSRYEIYIYTEPNDPEFLSVVEGRFARSSE